MIVGLKWSEDTSLKNLLDKYILVFDYSKEYAIRHSVSMEGTNKLMGGLKSGRGHKLGRDKLSVGRGDFLKVPLVGRNPLSLTPILNIMMMIIIIFIIIIEFNIYFITIFFLETFQALCIFLIVLEFIVCFMKTTL